MERGSVVELQIGNVSKEWQYDFCIRWYAACVPFSEARKQIEKEKLLKHANMLAYKNERWRRKVRERNYPKKRRFIHLTSSSGVYF